MELNKNKVENQVSAKALSQNSLDALRSALKEQPQRNSQRALTDRNQDRLRSQRSQATNQRRLSQIRNQEVVRQLNRVYQNRNNQANLRTNGTRTDTANLANQNPVLDPKSQELAEYLAKNGSLEGLSLDQAIQKRIESLQRVQKEFDPEKDPFVGLGSLGGQFAEELRNAQFLSSLVPTQALISLNLKELLKTPELVSDEAFLQNLLFWLKKKRKTRKYVDENDLLELVLIEFYPILLAGLTKIFSRGVSEEEVSTEMLSFNGELVQIMRSVSDPSHPAHEMLKTVQSMCQFTDVVRWDDMDLI